MFTFGPSFEAEMAYRIAERDAAARRAHDRRARRRALPRRRLLGRSPLTDLVALLERWVRPPRERRTTTPHLDAAHPHARW